MRKPPNPSKHELTRKRRQNWEQRWSDETFSALWLSDDIPSEIQTYIEQGWFTPETKVLDIGCGRGEVSFALAKAGLSVVGIDFSKAAIKEAKKRYQKNNLDIQFFCRDVCSRKMIALGRFNYLVDRGCFHVIPQQSQTAYAKTIADMVTPDGKFLLLHNHKQGSRADLQSRLAGVFAPSFQLIQFKDIEFGQGPEKIPGLALEFRRKLQE